MWGVCPARALGVLLFVKTQLTPSGKITIKINGEKEIIVDGGNGGTKIIESKLM